ncbi:EscF/YscF/HrpA family type III secretion system needle major subunit [Arsenophonus nasoniae]|uniref:EscF/YscF/HrpA family type III secretion system needle major subunit n=1 Tax=Arsenophonus nasoniae TaxID=638 RepID=D2TZU7_9GAMM|nr:EscF/YscF/HrpA family type III secretion system needle major subunit [Arsenophonus nasoniae]QBY41771.1 Type III secretion needle MxiH, YscF, SsaG, EprI, PscF, EscF [Arsenophonus nasoniae]WGM01804.1 EscF/YscF/HrpA family type III secretion system needle major subunit [Arsenophonus nasoniae]WGM05950.1 EscF/YscF/HrpA family type III secretion system needle major subunit [Arsenophonus nasoniae]WGM10961.1 EscF/YscF/HrpA family type III secretion system needle major subunit [Arsenophonus nasoniae]
MSIKNSTIGEILIKTGTKSSEYQTDINNAVERLKKDPSNSADLAEFQAAMAGYSILLNYISTTIKTHKENAQTILGNMR